MRATLALLLLLANPAAAAVSLTLSSASVPNSGDDATVCVALATGGEDVAGTQNDLVWDGRCATLPDGDRCYAAGTHGKGLQGMLLGNRDFTYRGLILSLTDVDPIDDGVLYCCSFIVEADPGQCCAVKIVGAEASDPRGHALGVTGTSGKLCVAADPNATPASTRTPTPTQCAGCVGSSGDGCHITGPSPAAGAGWPLAGAAALALLRRRRFRSPR